MNVFKGNLKKEQGDIAGATSKYSETLASCPVKMPKGKRKSIVRQLVFRWEN